MHDSSTPHRGNFSVILNPKIQQPSRSAVAEWGMVTPAFHQLFRPASPRKNYARRALKNLTHATISSFINQRRSLQISG
jgi:hypothetical protein